MALRRVRRPPPRPLVARVGGGTRAIADSSLSFVPSEDWLGGEGSDRAAASEKRAEALIACNAGLMRDFGVSASVVRRGGEPGLLFQSSSRVGAIPLQSPVTGRPDLGLVIEPRFRWSSLGEMLAGMGFRVVPDLLPLPELPQSERRVPPWVLSSIVLARLQRLLDSMYRRFQMVEIDRRAPQGAVLWNTYACSRLPHGRALDVPCRFPDLRHDEELRSAMHWVINRHRAALLGQTAAGLVVHQLLALCDVLLSKLRDSIPRVPQGNLRGSLRRHALSSRVFREGLQAIDWTIDERGLAGLSDLAGLAWRMDMEIFFEAWVEAVAEATARRTGATLSVGRREQTRVPIDWRPPSLGSQRSLLPDVVLQREDVVVVVDAKYKRHAEQIEHLGWHDVDQNVREEHRNDVLQALAYSTLFDAPRVVACLAYPAAPSVWEELRRRDRVLSRAPVRAGGRKVELALLAVPLSGRVDTPGAVLEELVRRAA
jgi:hypothetical protein